MRNITVKTHPSSALLKKEDQLVSKKDSFVFPEKKPSIYKSKTETAEKSSILNQKDFERATTGYLKADPKRVEDLSQELGIGNKKVIGISWKSIKSLHTLKKSLSLMELGKIFQDLDVVLLNLQYGDVNEEIKEFTKATGIEVLQCKSVDNREDLDGLAALIENCDLVVSTSGHSGITIRSGTSSNGNIFFADGTSGGDEYRGVIDYNHSSNHMSFSTNAVERVRIDSSGNSVSYTHLTLPTNREV